MFDLIESTFIYNQFTYNPLWFVSLSWRMKKYIRG